MEDAGVIKLYEPSPTSCLYAAPAENMMGKTPLIHSKSRDSGFMMGSADAAALRMAGVAAICMRLTLSCGSLGAICHGLPGCREEERSKGYPG